MAEFDEQIDSIPNEMEEFLRAKARSQPTPAHPIFLRSQYKTNLRVTDADKNTFTIDESFLSNFRDTYTDRNFKAVKLNSWEFELIFQGKTCTRVSLISDSVTFLSSKSIKKEITGCHFKIAIAQDDEIRNFSPELRGYLNRIGKGKVCESSNNAAGEMKSLLSFATPRVQQVQAFNYKPWNKPEVRVTDPLSTLNPEGKKVLEKLRNFIRREHIQSFIVEEEVSGEAAEALRKLIASK